jgi:hypothetical protein
MNDSAAVRAAEEKSLAVDYLENGDLYNGTMHLGAMTHYISDLAVFGNVMNATYWGIPTHYDDYMDYVNSRMTSYNSEFNNNLSYMSTLGIGEAYDGALLVAFNTTFNPKGTNPNGSYRNCTWMDSNYSWSDPKFRERAGESLNFAVNNIAAILKTMYKNNLTTPAKPKNFDIINVEGHSINLTWDANTENSIAGYSIFINKTDSTTEFETEPITNITSGTSYSVQNLMSETEYAFRLQAYSVVGKKSQYSDIATATTKDITPPAAPTIFSLPSITNKQQLLVNGKGEKNTRVEIYLNNNYSSPVGMKNITDDIAIFTVEITIVEGENNITARAFDTSENRGPFANYRIVILDSISPIADAGANIETEKREDPVSVQFDGTNSTDNLGEIKDYSWTIDLKSKLIHLTGSKPEYIFESSGEYTVTLNITDNVNNWATDLIWVNITQLDYKSPIIITRTPEPDSINQSVNMSISAIFNEPLNSSISISLWSKSEGILEIPSPSYNLAKNLLTLKPFADLRYDTTYRVKIIATDLSGNPLTGGTWNFSTELRPEDYDGDEIPDEWEWKFGLDGNKSDGSSDEDDDGLTNFEEYNYGNNPTDPTNPDSDSDGMSDYFERLYSLNPLSANDSSEDPDDDGYSNLDEYELGSHPRDPSSPEDGTRNGNGGDDNNIWIVSAIVIIIIIVLILLLLLRKLKYKPTGEVVKDDDGYLKTKDAKELGVGGDIIFQGPNQYVFEGKTVKDTHRGPKDGEEQVVATTAKGPISDRPTPSEIIKRAKETEKKCPKCKAGLPEDTIYCFECGEVFEEK